MVILKEDCISSCIFCSDGVGTKLSHDGSEDWGFVLSFSEFSESSFFLLFTTKPLLNKSLIYSHIGGLYMIDDTKKLIFNCKDFYNENAKHFICNNEFRGGI